MTLLSDVWTFIARNTRRHVRAPSQLAYSTALPVMWVVLFVAVFGGAMRVPGQRYVDYLVPGILVLSVAFGMANTALGISDDLASGVLERFLSQPVNRAAMLIGRVLFDALRNTGALLVSIAVGYAMGFRFRNGVADAVATVVLVVAIGFALSWVGVLIGLSTRDPEAAQTGSILVAIPVMFASSTFVPVSSMPGWLQAVARYNPVTAAVDAGRALSIGGASTRPVLTTVLWVVGLVAVALPLAVWRFRRVAAS